MSKQELMLAIQVIDLAVACGVVFRTVPPAVVASITCWWVAHIGLLPPGKREIFIFCAAGAVGASWFARVRRRTAADDHAIALMAADVASVIRSPFSGRAIALAACICLLLAMNFA